MSNRHAYSTCFVWRHILCSCGFDHLVAMVMYAWVERSCESSAMTVTCTEEGFWFRIKNYLDLPTIVKLFVICDCIDGSVVLRMRCWKSKQKERLVTALQNHQFPNVKIYSSQDALCAYRSAQSSTASPWWTRSSPTRSNEAFPNTKSLPSNLRQLQRDRWLKAWEITKFLNEVMFNSVIIRGAS